ncbi:MAG: hypothetical protein PWP67_2616 [Clostridium butyricum]|nr:hypothetical protein [Clostridium butyricum]MDU4750425.1 site-specific integrase [Clostridium butyricum]MDU4856342.1 site-specific integrase [Clostridioides difficile]
MAKTTYKKKVKNGKEYYFFRMRHENLKTPKDLYGSTTKELDQKIKELKNRLDNNILDNKEYFETFLYNWLFDVKFMELKESTKERYEILYRKYIKDSYVSKIKIKDISLQDIQAYYADLLKKDTSVNCISNVHKIIAPCIRYAYDNDIILKDFTKAIKLPKENEEDKLSRESKVQPLTLEEQKQFVNAIKGHELETLFLTALNTGMRQGELFALTWNDIDFDKCYIDVNKSAKGVTPLTKDGGRGHYTTIVQTPKTKGSIRKVPVPKTLLEQLKHFKVQQLENKLALANLYNDNNLVFCTMFGKYFNSANVRKRFNHVLQTLGIEHHRFHDLRHTYATRLFELGENPKTVQTLLGHSNIATTLNTYTHVLTSMKESAANKLDELFKTM